MTLLRRSYFASILVAAALVGLTVTGCGDDEGNDGAAGAAGTAGDGDGDGDAGHSGSHGDGDGDGDGDADPNIDSAAADLRVSLDLLLSEHLVLAAKATGAALGGRTDEYEAYGDALTDNGLELGALVGAAYGDEAEGAFNDIWGAHNGFFVQYTTGVATDDMEMQDAAVASLTESYVPDFAELLAGATEIPQADLEELILHHVLTTKDIVDMQAAEDWPGAFEAIRDAFAHMAMIGDPLAAAIAGQYPEDFAGDNTTAPVDFRVALNTLLQEHMYLASFATGAALGGRMEEYEAAGGALTTNGTDLGGAVESIYGEEAGAEFNRIWAAHNGFFVDYTVGVATDDMDAQDEAVASLTNTYVPEFSALLAGATGLPQDTIAGLTASHVLSTKAVVDAQAEGDFAMAAELDRESAHHMRSIGDPLSVAIVASMPDKL